MQPIHQNLSLMLPARRMISFTAWWVFSILLLIPYSAFAQTCTPAPSGAIAWWPFDETSGTIAQDIVGTKPGVHFGAPAHTPGKVGNALRFNGVDDFVGVGDSDLWAFGANDFTIELWANFSSPGGGSIGHPSHIFIGNDEGPGLRKKWFFALGGGYLNFHLVDPSAYATFIALTPFSPTVGQWYHLAVTRNGDTFTIFIDGVPSGAEVFPNPLPNPNAPLTIGQAESLGFMNGLLDDIAIYNRALTQAELQSIVSAGSAGKCKSQSTFASAISPSSGGDTGSVTVQINGSGFSNGATVKLARTGSPDIVGNFASVGQDGRTITTTFDLTGKARGLWDVVVANPSGTSITFPQGFTIEEGRAQQVWVDIIGRGAIRAGRPQQFQVLYGNRGNVDAVEGVIIISWPKEDDLSIEGAVSAYGEPLPLPITEGSLSAQGIFIPETRAGSVSSIPINFVAKGLAPKVIIGVAFLQAPQAKPLVTTSDNLLSEAFTYPLRGLITSQMSDPPVGSTVFMSPRAGNPYGHEGMVDLRSDGTPGVWDLWLTEDLKKTPEGRQFIEEVGQPIPLSRPGPDNDWIDRVGGKYLGWGVPQGWTEEIGKKAAAEYKNLLVEGKAHYALTWGKDPKNMRFNCSSIDEYAYELAGLDPIPDKVQDVPEETLLTPAFHYRLYTGKQDFFKSLTLFQRIIFGLAILHEIENAHLVDYLRERGLTKEANADVVTAYDPNDKIGSKGIGMPKHLSGEDPLRYVILFENVETATAPAQDVVITDQLDAANLDFTTFSLGPITFGNKQIIPPPGLISYQTEVDLRPGKNLLVRVEGNLNTTNGLLSWRFTSIDPTTGLPPDDPFAGFLPPNKVPPEGDGSVLFTVMPKKGLPTGTEIRNKARIIFDTNAPIDTPQWLNTLDNTKPTSKVLSVNAKQCAPSFQVKWSGADVGAGIRDYTVFVSENGGPYVAWLSNTMATEGTFTGQAGKSYAFYSLARDLTNNLENAKTVAEATTQVVTPVSLAAATLPNGLSGQAYPATNISFSGGTAPYTVNVTGLPTGMTFSVTGTTVTIKGTPTQAGNFNVNVSVQDNNSCPSSRNYPLTIINTCGIAIYPTPLAQPYIGIPYAQTLFATPTGDYTFSLAGGALPPGLQVVKEFGFYYLKGTPTTPGTYDFTIKAKQNNSLCENIRGYTVTIAPTVVPILECVQRNANGSYTARFGYDNTMGAVVTIPVGANNYFTPGNQNRGQTTVFQQGRVFNAFSVTFTVLNTSNLATWLLKGPDGLLRSVNITTAKLGCP